LDKEMKLKRKVWVSVLAALAVVGVIVSLLVADAFFKAARSAKRSACIGNLRLLSDAKAQWALDEEKESGDIPAFEDISVYAGGSRGIFCPLISMHLRTGYSNSYSINAIGEKPRCKIGEHRGHDLSYSGQ
jgi:hypothetical protein